jgi:hypothetical protein
MTQSNDMDGVFYKGAEIPMPGAPAVKLDNGDSCIPQHYLKYQHTLKSVQEIVSHIEFSKKYPVFVCEDECGLYVQVGIIGHDNYKRASAKPLKIVYGRKWRVEPNLPTAEVVQTVFLALKKAREHEVRELLTLRSAVSGRVSTPFNNHHDIVFMAQNVSFFEKAESQMRGGESYVDRFCTCLDLVRFDGRFVECVDVEECRNGMALVDLELRGEAVNMPEILGRFSVLVRDFSENEFLYSLMEELLRLNDRYVDEQFKYLDFPRFSRQQSIEQIGEMSILLRNQDLSGTDFDKTFFDMNYEVDATRVPKLGEGALADKIRENLRSFGVLDGQLPVL